MSASALSVPAVGKSRHPIRCSGELQDPYRTKEQIIVPLRKSRLSWRPRQLPLNRKSFTRMTKKQHGSASSERMLSFLHSETTGDMPLSWPKLSIQHLAAAPTDSSVRVTIDFQVSCRLLGRQVCMPSCKQAYVLTLNRRRRKEYYHQIGHRSQN